MEATPRSKAGPPRAGKKASRAKKPGEPGPASEKKNFSSRNINKIIRNVKKQEKQRKNTLKYSAHGRRPKPNEFFYRKIRQKRATGDPNEGRGSVNADIRRFLEGAKRPKKRVKTARVLTQETEDGNKDRSLEWLSKRPKNLQHDFSMSEDASADSSKKEMRTVKEGERDSQALGPSTRKKNKFQLPGKKKSQSKFGYKQLRREPRKATVRRKGTSQLRLAKTPQAKKKFLKHPLQKNAEDSQERLKKEFPLPESSECNRLQKKEQLPKSARNVPKTGLTYFANSTNNIPLVSDLQAERPVNRPKKNRRFPKKSKSNSNATKLMGLDLDRPRTKKSVYKQKRRKLNNTYTQDLPSNRDKGLGISKVSAHPKRRASKSPHELFRASPLESPHSRTNSRNFDPAFGDGFNRPPTASMEFGVERPFAQFKPLDNTNRPIFYKNTDYFQVTSLPKPRVVKYRESARPRQGLRGPKVSAEGEVFVRPSLDYKIYSDKNLENLPKSSLVPVKVAPANWHSQRNSHSNMIELIRVPIQALENYPMDDGKIYFQKANTLGTSRPESHMNSYGEFQGSPYSHFVAQQMDSKPFHGAHEVTRGSKAYYEPRQFDRVLSGPQLEGDLYKMQGYPPGALRYIADQQQFLMVRKGSNEGSVWVKTRINENQGKRFSNDGRQKASR